MCCAMQRQQRLLPQIDHSLKSSPTVAHHDTKTRKEKRVKASIGSEMGLDRHVAAGREASWKGNGEMYACASCYGHGMEVSGLGKMISGMATASAYLA